MQIIIDGYNLLKARFGPHASEKQRERLIAMVAQYAQVKKHDITIVFDGGPLNRATHDRMHGVEIICAGAGRSADDEIKMLLDKIRGNEILLVSSDNELCAYADRLQIPSLEALGFWYTMVGERVAVGTPSSYVKTSADMQKAVATIYKEERGGEDAELDALMEEASRVIMPKDEEQYEHGRKSKAERLSKQERLLLRKIKKL